MKAAGKTRKLLRLSILNKSISSTNALLYTTWRVPDPSSTSQHQTLASAETRQVGQEEEEQEEEEEEEEEEEVEEEEGKSG